MPHALHHRSHVGEIEVDLARHGDDVADALHGLSQYVVSHPERFGDGRVAGHRLEQAIVRDRDHRVDALLQLSQAVERLVHATLALEAERQRDHGNGQDAVVVAAELTADRRDDRRRAGAGSATEPRGHEDHVGPLEGVADLLGVLDGALAADVRVGAGAESLGQLGADLDLDGRAVRVERLDVGVDRDELDAREPRRDHAGDGVSATTSDADDLDTRVARLSVGEGDAARVGYVAHLQIPSEQPVMNPHFGQIRLYWLAITTAPHISQRGSPEDATRAPRSATSRGGRRMTGIGLVATPSRFT